jgi:hypothetical protein
MPTKKNFTGNVLVYASTKFNRILFNNFADEHERSSKYSFINGAMFFSMCIFTVGKALAQVMTVRPLN